MEQGVATFHGFGGSFHRFTQIRDVVDIDPRQYSSYVMDGIGEKRSPLKDVYAGFILGSPAFIKEKLQELKSKVDGKDFSYKNELNSSVDAKRIIELVSKKFGVDMSEPAKHKNRRTREKKIAIYLLKKYSGLSNEDIGKMFGISYSAASKAAISIDREMLNDKQLKKDIEKLDSSFKD